MGGFSHLALHFGWRDGGQHESGFVADGGSVASGQGFVAERDGPSQNLQPCVPTRRQRLLNLLIRFELGEKN